MNVPEEILAKVRKLLRLGDSDNPHEAALATARAQAIMEKYQIQVMDLEVAEPLPEVGEHEDLISYDGGKLYQWRIHLVDSLARAHRCRVFIRQREVEGKGYQRVWSKRMVLVGTRNDAATVGYLYSALVREVEGLVKVHAQGKGKRYVNSFRLGVVTAIDQALYAERQRTRQWAQVEGHGAALVRMDQVEALADKVLEDMDTLKSKSTAPDPLALARGYRAGQAIDVGRTDPESRGLPAPPERLEE